MEKAVNGRAESCRISLEAGEGFRFEYATPEDFRPRAMPEICTLCETVRCGGDFHIA